MRPPGTFGRGVVWVYILIGSNREKFLKFFFWKTNTKGALCNTYENVERNIKIFLNKIYSTKMFRNLVCVFLSKFKKCHSIIV